MVDRQKLERILVDGIQISNVRSIMDGNLSTVCNIKPWIILLDLPLIFARRNDLRLFRESNINERMRNAGDWIIFGDSAYKEHTAIVKVIDLVTGSSIMR